MDFLINFYRETFKRKVIRPVQVFLAEINTPLELIKSIVYLLAFAYLLGINLSMSLKVILGVLIFIVAWAAGNLLIKYRIPHTQNEINNELNPQINLLNKIAKKLKV